MLIIKQHCFLFNCCKCSYYFWYLPAEIKKDLFF